MGSPRRKPRDIYKSESKGPVEGVVAAETEAPSRFGSYVTEAGNTGKRAVLSFVNVGSEICHKHVGFGGIGKNLICTWPWWY